VAATVTGGGDLWVANAAANSLTEYAPGADGDAAPIATVSGSSTLLNMPSGVTEDSAGNLLVANLAGESIARFPATANGNVAPTSLIQGADTTLDFPHGVSVDPQGRIYVPNQFGDSISVFAAAASDDASPVATITGGSTGLSGPQAVAVLPPPGTATAPTARLAPSTSADRLVARETRQVRSRHHALLIPVGSLPSRKDTEDHGHRPGRR
jgi:hypothetical protein